MSGIDFTDAQKRVKNFCGEKNMLVSASAGTGKTTTMIECIASLLRGTEERTPVDVSEIVVVTFTNLAAAEMKAKLAQKLSAMCGEKGAKDRNWLAEQLEKLDNAAICTLHSFCSDLLRNYFYVVNIDPAFAILDALTVASLRKNALDDLFAEYFSKDDPVFREIYKIFSVNRREDNFRETLLRLYDFSRCQENFEQWYQQTRQSFVTFGEGNEIARSLKEDICQTLDYQAENMRKLATRAEEAQLAYANVFQHNADVLKSLSERDLQAILNGLYTLTLESLPPKKKNAQTDKNEEEIRQHYKQLKKDFDDRAKKYSNLCRGEQLSELWREMSLSVCHVDKMVELVTRFDELFWEEKRQRGGVDFNDLEHLTLKLLSDPDTLAEIQRRYKLVFVDEYQDTNPVQEAIVNKLSKQNNLFMVGDVKQSIYGFRGCEPSIFADKYERYKRTKEGEAEELNDNFRADSRILNFVNKVFENLMTERFGKVDYANDAKLSGRKTSPLDVVPVKINVIVKPKSEKKAIETVYDITAKVAEDGVKQGELISNRIKAYVGKKYFVKDDDGNLVERKIDYGDIVILMRSMTERAQDIYRTLVENNIPVAASFKVEGYSNKEVRDVINLLRVIDNPYNDIYLVGACLTFGKLTESELVPIRLDTTGRVPFYERLVSYADVGASLEIASKVRTFLQFLEQIRFYSYGASVCETVLKIFELTDYRLAVQQLPTGNMRLNKLHAFVDSIKDAAFAQSIAKFLAYVDETQEQSADAPIVPNAVRMMTMHASKGLEFPIVIIAGLEASFNFDRYSLKTNSKLGAALDYYNIQTMRVTQTVGSFVCDAVNQFKQREEEMRLLYVALTRAKFALELVATVDEARLTQLPKQQTRATSHFDWLHKLLFGKYDQKTVSDGVEVELVGAVEKLPSKGSDAGEQTVTVEEVREKLNFAYSYVNETKMPSKVVSSLLDKEYIDVTDEPKPDFVLNVDGDRNEVGSAYHKVLQYVDYRADTEQIKQCVEDLVNEERVDRRFADKLDVKLIFDVLNNPELRALLSKGKAYHEIPFMLYVPYDELSQDKRFKDNVMLQGVIDLLVKNGDDAVVVDFKYTTRSDLVEQRYAAQLKSYRLAVQRICGVKNVECYVLSIADNKLIKM